MKKTILITGATGTIGSRVARDLLETNQYEVRVATRDAKRAADLSERGARVVEVDLLDEDALAAALEGVDRLFLVGPEAEDFGTRVAKIARIAEDAGVEHVVRLSALGSATDAAFPIARQHGHADAALRASKLGWTILQPTFFQDNVLKFAGTTIRDQGAFYGAAADGKAAYVSADDVARVAVAALASPEAHRGQTYVLTGPEAITSDQVAQLVSAAAGHAVRYVDVGDEQLAASMRERGLPEWFVESMVGLERVKRNGWAEATSGAVEAITGRSPERYEAFLARHASALARV